MPLPKATGHSKKAINKQISANIRELYHNGKTKRSHDQIVAIGIQTATGRKGRFSKRKS